MMIIVMMITMIRRIARSVLGAAKRQFHLNICQKVHSPACSDDSMVCEVDDTNENMINETNGVKSVTKQVEYNAESEEIVLSYVGKNHTTHIVIQCEKAAVDDPQVSFISQDDTTTTFRFLTAKACLAPALQVRPFRKVKYFCIQSTKTSPLPQKVRG